MFFWGKGGQKPKHHNLQRKKQEMRKQPKNEKHVERAALCNLLIPRDPQGEQQLRTRTKNIVGTPAKIWQ